MRNNQVTQDNFISVLEKIKEHYVDEADDFKYRWVEAVNEMLDTLADDDFFGTEGQNDPRGDQRD